MNKRLSQKDMKLLIILLAILILAGAYQFVYVKNMDQLDVIQDENAQLQTKLMDLRNKESKRADVEKENEQIKKDITAKINAYGTGASNEKSIMFIRNIEIDNEVQIGSATLMEPAYFLSPVELDNGTNPEVYNINAMEGYQSTVLIDFRSSYDGLKKSIDYINQYGEKSTIDEITISYDSETGNLGGTLSISSYHLMGPGRYYSDPVIGGVDIGMDNIFGTIDLPVAEEKQGEGTPE